MIGSFHTIVVGTGFASSFFLREHLTRQPQNARILVLERGPRLDHDSLIRLRRRSLTAQNAVMDDFSSSPQVLRHAGLPKLWLYTIGFGGSSNCWWACASRMLPNDFRMKTLYGVARDWPIGYDDLVPFYDEVEDVMQISGANDGSPYPRSKPHPQAPHRFTDPDRMLKARFPELFFQQPTARARIATATRNACCANGVCHLCPVDAKFTVLNGMSDIYKDPRITLLTEAEVHYVDIVGGVARGVVYRQNGVEKNVRADLVVLGANAMFNPFLMLRSGLRHPLLGRRLNDQMEMVAEVYLHGIENLSGSTSITGQGYMLYDGPHRAERAGVLIETYNLPIYRPEPGRWREIWELHFVVEDLPLERNRVEVDPENPERPLAIYEARSEYGLATVRQLPKLAEDMLEGLPVERIHFLSTTAMSTAVHNQCTTVMGNDPADSIVDRNLVCHSVRNLLVLGTSVFPTGPPAPPTVTLSALSLHAARAL